MRRAKSREHPLLQNREKGIFRGARKIMKKGPDLKRLRVRKKSLLTTFPK